MASRLESSRATALARLASAGSLCILTAHSTTGPVPSTRTARAVLHDRHDTQIDARRQPPVEPNFLLAPVPSLFERCCSPGSRERPAS